MSIDDQRAAIAGLRSENDSAGRPCPDLDGALNEWQAKLDAGLPIGEVGVDFLQRFSAGWPD